MQHKRAKYRKVVIPYSVEGAGGGWKKFARMEKNCVPPPPSRGCLRKKKPSRHNCSVCKIFTQGQLLVQKWNSLHQISLCTLACTELFEPIDHFKFVLLVDVICEVAFFLPLGTNVGTRIEFFASNW